MQLKCMIGDGIHALANYLISFAERKSPAAFFITGTDTGVGKTHVACALIRELRRRNIRAAGLKPICCGDRADARELWKCSGREIPLDVINPIHLPQPLAPVSQSGPSWPVLLRRARHAFGQFAAWNTRIILVEGAGGLLCPITKKNTMRELARALGLPVVVVARNQLGVLNHALLTVAAASAAGIECTAIVLNSPGGRMDHSSKTNAKALAQLTRIPVFKF